MFDRFRRRDIPLERDANVKETAVITGPFQTIYGSTSMRLPGVSVKTFLGALSGNDSPP